MTKAMDPLKPMRVASLVRLVNSTPLGVVIAPYLLYRHRTMAEGRIDQDGGVTLAKYAAWLLEMRSEGLIVRGRRRRTPSVIQDDGSVNKQSVLALLRRQDFRCALTGRLLVPQRAALDHIVPVSRGGAHRIDNAQVLDKAVNRAKGTLTNKEFIALCGEVWRFAKSQGPADVAGHGGSASVGDEESLFLMTEGASDED